MTLLIVTKSSKDGTVRLYGDKRSYGVKSHTIEDDRVKVEKINDNVLIGFSGTSYVCDKVKYLIRLDGYDELLQEMIKVRSMSSAGNRLFIDTLKDGKGMVSRYVWKKLVPEVCSCGSLNKEHTATMLFVIFGHIYEISTTGVVYEYDDDVVYIGSGRGFVTGWLHAKSKKSRSDLSPRQISDLFKGVSKYNAPVSASHDMVEWRP